MAAKTTIEWTEVTWNPVTGCDKVSPGCKHCYAERLARRLHAMGNQRYRQGFSVTLHHDLVELPLSWKKPRMIFVNSMSDLFHEGVPLEFIQAVFETMTKARQHTFQILTKRSQRLAEVANELPWPPNVWIGVSVESQTFTWRIEHLRQVNASVRFLSLEPLLGPIDDLPLEGIHWVIVGGESGPGARPIQADWVRAIRDRCLDAGVPFFFKQWGGVRKKANGRILDDHVWDDFPVRETATTLCTRPK